MYLVCFLTWGDYERSMWRKNADIVGSNAAHDVNHSVCKLSLRHVSKSAVQLHSSGKGRCVHQTLRMVATMSQKRPDRVAQGESVHPRTLSGATDVGTAGGATEFAVEVPTGVASAGATTEVAPEVATHVATELTLIQATRMGRILMDRRDRVRFTMLILRDTPVDRPQLPGCTWCGLPTDGT